MLWSISRGIYECIIMFIVDPISLTMHGSGSDWLAMTKPGRVYEVSIRHVDHTIQAASSALLTESKFLRLRSMPRMHPNQNIAGLIPLSLEAPFCSVEAAVFILGARVKQFQATNAGDCAPKP